jgi:NAD(P)-dependent dehydrogenase (short-subunit alcohol dehydrogenase family)
MSALDAFRLDGKVALVTGGNSGIGEAIALAYRDAGARVAIGSRRSDRNARTLEKLGEGHLAVSLDVADEESVEKAIARVVEEFGRIDILVNNAGIGQRASVTELDLATWRQVLDVNVTGAFLCTKHVARRMVAQGSGKIVNIASIYGLTAPSKGLQVAYTVSKHALVALTKVNAAELGANGVQVNCVAPGWFFTEMTDELRGTGFERAVKERTPMGRWGDTRDLAGACLFLASPASEFVSGAVMPVDGGYMAHDGLRR